MKTLASMMITGLTFFPLLNCGPSNSKTEACRPGKPASGVSSDYALKGISVGYDAELDLLVFEQTVAGTAGATVPRPAGKLNGAPVEGYVFPTSLKSTDVGFDDTSGIVALAVTAHPDFDDTPLWDENNDRNYKNDGGVFHSHWVLLRKDKRVAGGFSVKATSKSSVLPATNPGMPMYMDSPGFSIVKKGSRIRVLVPAQRVNHKTNFKFDGVTAFMRVSTEKGTPMLGVYKVYGICSGDLSLPYTVKRR